MDISNYDALIDQTSINNARNVKIGSDFSIVKNNLSF